MIHLGCRAFYKEDDILWFSNYNFNKLFQVNLKNGEIKSLHKFKNIPSSKVGAHSKIYKNGNELIFIPLTDDKLIIYNLETNDEIEIKLPIAGFAGSYKNGNRIWLFPTFITEDILCVDIEMKSVEKDVKLCESMRAYSGGKKVVCRFTAYENKVILCEDKKNRVYEINMDTRKVERFNIDIPESNIIKVCFDGKTYWCMQFYSHDVYGWNKEEKTYVKYVSEECEFIDNIKMVPYYNILLRDEKVILLSHSAKGIYTLNREKRSVEKLFDFPEEVKAIQCGVYSPVYSGGVCSGNEIHFIPERGSHLLSYDVSTQDVSKIELVISKGEIEDFNQIIQEKIQSDIVKECAEICNLTDYINNIKFSNANSKKSDIGKSVYEKINA